MPARFWSCTVWFVILGINAVIEFVYALKKSKDRGYTAAVYFITCGLTFAFEATVCCFLKAYDYYPGIFPKSYLDEEIAGNLFSQFSVNATALIIAVLDLKFLWYLICAGLYGIVEVSFMALGIYSHNWFRTWMTILGLVILFAITKSIYKSCYKPIKKIYRYFLIYFGVYTLHMPGVYWAMLLSGIAANNTRLLPDAMQSYAFISLVNLTVLFVVCMFIHFSKLKSVWKLLMILCLFIILHTACRLYLINVKAGWFPVFATIDIFGMLLTVFLMDRLFKANPGKGAAFNK